MGRLRLILFLLLASPVEAYARQEPPTGAVTYLSSGTVYVSLGRSSGVVDSTLLYVMSGPDTVATLQAYAVSSSSAACRVVRTERPIVVGDVVRSSVPAPVEEAPSPPAAGPGPAPGPTSPSTGPRGPPITLRGRVGLQYAGTRFGDATLDRTQPALVMSLRGGANGAPISFELYGNFRRISEGGGGPFSGSSEDASRIYRLSLRYDGPRDALSAGRILPTYAPSVGAIDGLSYEHRMGALLLGLSVGYRAGYGLLDLATKSRKYVLFGQYRSPSSSGLTITGAYARTYEKAWIDREAVSVGLSAVTGGGTSVFGYADVDLRRKEGGANILSPRFSRAYLVVNKRLSGILSVGLGADASRSILPFSAVRTLPDSLLDSSIKSGAFLRVSLSLPGGVGFTNSFTPRDAGSGFGSQYANYSSFYMTDVMGTGLRVQGSMALSANGLTDSHGYGLTVGGAVGRVDWIARHQATTHRFQVVGNSGSNSTTGLDLMAPLGQRLYLVATVDRMVGYGSDALALFTELSWRF